MIVGVLVSGYLMKRYRPTARQVAALVLGSKFIYAFGLMGLMLLNCPFDGDFPGQWDLIDNRLQLDQTCNDGCHCQALQFIPTCARAVNGSSKNYFSPCHAGCTEPNNANQSKGYQNCRFAPSAHTFT